MNDQLTTAFVVKGFAESKYAEKAYELLNEGMGIGQTDVIQFLVDVAPHVDALYTPHVAKNWAHIFVYDVAEPVGLWIAEYVNAVDDLPTAKHVVDYGSTLINALIEQHDKEPA